MIHHDNKELSQTEITTDLIDTEVLSRIGTKCVVVDDFLIGTAVITGADLDSHSVSIDLQYYIYEGFMVSDVECLTVPLTLTVTIPKSNLRIRQEENRWSAAKGIGEWCFDPDTVNQMINVARRLKDPQSWAAYDELLAALDTSYP